MKKLLLFFTLFVLYTNLTFSQVGCLSGNCINGFGIYKGEEGDSYEGYWVEGLRVGEGYYVWKDGSSYRGNFVANACEGKGIFTGIDGTIFDGYFVNGMYVGTAAPDNYDDDYEYLEKVYLVDTVLDVNDEEDYFDDEYYDEEYYEEDFSDGYQDYENFLEEMGEEKTIFLEPEDVFEFIIEGFESSYEYLKLGIDTSNTFSEQYFSLVSFNFAKPAVINLSLVFNSWQWYNIIVEDTVFLDAKQQYDNYIGIIDSLKIVCCEVTKKYTQTIDENNENYTTSWHVSKAKEGFDPMYWNMRISVELYRQYNSDKFTVLVRVNDSSH